MKQISTESLALHIRKESARIISQAKSSHIGGVYSCADIVALLYSEALRFEGGSFVDSLILSKGHCCAAIYTALHGLGLISDDLLDSYGKNGSPLMLHISHHAPFVEFSTGSLGHGLSFSVGISIASRRKSDKSVYALLSDGELDEGSNWEAVHLAGHLGLSNLVAFIDYNKLQSLDSTENTVRLEPLAEKFRSFHWSVLECDGHNHEDLRMALDQRSRIKPTVIIAHTTKGYPVDFMMGKVAWHYKSPDEVQLTLINKQLGSEACI